MGELGIWVIVIIVQVLGKYMSIRHLDPQGIIFFGSCEFEETPLHRLLNTASRHQIGCDYKVVKGCRVLQFSLSVVKTL